MELASTLRRSLKRAGRAVAASGPLYALARARALRDDPVTVLMYHTLGGDDEDFDAWTVVRRGDFLRQLAHLRAEYRIVDLDAALAPPDPADPRPRAVITFDDGHDGLYTQLLPLLERERVPVTVYVATGHIDSGRPYWFDRVMNALQTTVPARLDLRAEGLGQWALGRTRGVANWAALSPVLQALKDVEPARREHLAGLIEAQLAAQPRPRFAPLAPLSLAQLRELAASPWVTIGAHTHCHSLLDQLPLAEASASIARSRELLQRWTGRSVAHFAYPNGNHDAALVAETARLGFASACTTCKGLWHGGAAPHAIPRVPVGRYDDFDRFKLELLGGLPLPHAA